MSNEKLAQDFTTILSIGSHFGLPIPSPEDIKEEELSFLLASVSTYLLKRAISGREDAEHINFLWIEAEKNMVKKSD